MHQLPKEGQELSGKAAKTHSAPVYLLMEVIQTPSDTNDLSTEQYGFSQLRYLDGYRDWMVLLQDEPR